MVCFILVEGEGERGCVCLPCVPEEADWEDDSADYHGREALLWDRLPMLDVCFCEVCSSRVSDSACAESDAKEEWEEGE